MDEVKQLAYPHKPVRSAWLALHHEAALLPELPIVDPHHHLWEVGPHGSRYMPDALAQDFHSGHRVIGSVFLQCGFDHDLDAPPALQPVGETRRVAALAEEAAQTGLRQALTGIVGYADCRLGASIDAVLEAHLEAAPERFKGIRHGAAFDATIAPTNAFPMPPGLYRDASFQQGVRRLARYGLSFDAWLYHPQLPDLAALAEAAPEVPIVINHLGGPLGVGPYAADAHRPALDDGTGRAVAPMSGLAFEAWRTQMEQLAAYPNLSIKLGGLSMSINGFAWDSAIAPPDSACLARAWRPYMEAAIDAFGSARCMFESNFPVDKAMCSYGVLWNAFKRIAADASASEQADLFHRSAQRFYRLPYCLPGLGDAQPAAPSPASPADSSS